MNDYNEKDLVPEKDENNETVPQSTPAEPCECPSPAPEAANAPEAAVAPEAEQPLPRAEGSFPPPPPQATPVNSEYRYTPPYSGIGANTPHAPRPEGAVPPPPPREPVKNREGKKKKEKTVRTFPTVAIVFIIIGSMLLSFASGMLGSLIIVGGFELMESANNDNVEQNPSTDKNSDDKLTIQKPDKNETDTDTDKVFAGTDLSEVAAFVSASVVEITTEFNTTYHGYYQYVQEGAGSGVIISENGYIITNAHVITDTTDGSLADTIKVRLTNSEEYTAKIIGSDPASDIALIKIDGSNFTAATIGNSDSIKVGEQILAVGNPLGELGGTVTGGIISSTNREISVENNRMTLIQIDAAINPGNSGGGLFNLEGELIGIVNAKTTDVTVEGLGFAIPVNEAIHVAEELEECGYVTGRTHIGISLTDVTDSYSAYYYFRSEATGVYIVNVQEGYNDKVLKYGDRITAINGDEVNSTEDVKTIVSDSKVGDVLTFTISREGKLKEVKVTCYEYVPETNVSFN